MKFNPACIRKTANWTTVKANHKFDKKGFDPKSVLKDLPIVSPKMAKLFENIKKLDEADMNETGHLHKHFIFSELKGLAGAKIIASAFSASGYKLIFNNKQKLLSDDELLQNKFNNFGLMVNSAVWEKPMQVALKKQVIAKFNSRPDNSHGELCRFIILSGDFKEGIDLFDCKYVHIMEPQTSRADLRQAVGRATRLCGNKGLEFHPSMGWPLNVMIYDVDIPPEVAEKVDAKTFHELFLKNSKVDLKVVSFAEQLESASIQGAVDYELTKNIHNFKIDDPDNDLRLDEFFRTPDSKGGALADIKDFKCNANCKTRPCKQFPLGTPLMIAVYVILDRSFPNLRKLKPRAEFCKVMKSDKEYCAELRKAWDDPRTYLNEASHISKIEAFVKAQKHYLLKMSHRRAFLKFCQDAIPSIKDILKKALSILSDKKRKSPHVSASPLPDTPASASPVVSAYEIPPMKDGASFMDVRQYIREYFTQFMWPKAKLENLCASKGGASTVAQFTPTQDFIRHYFTPQSPQKGMLIWHSVGTGKTCTAISTATTQFENAGYTILWVTRASLKQDIWKNMFDLVCHSELQDKIKAGVNIPSDMPSRMKLLSNSWRIHPISYKQFSNLVSARNDYYKRLVKINGKEDPLRKTLLIIDESHKLYGGSDLASNERPDMKKLHQALLNSYEKSGKNSVKLLMMTGTPMTNDPMELIKLINLVKTKEDQLPTSFDEFSQIYLDDSGYFTKKGKARYLNDIAGHVSYLNRERDARQFPQPELSFVKVEMTHPGDLQGYGNDDKIKELKESIKEIENAKKESKESIDKKKEECKNLTKAEYKACREELKRIQSESKETLDSRMKDKKAFMKELKDIQKKLKKNDGNGNQLSDLFTKCTKSKPTTAKKGTAKKKRAD